MKLTRKTARQVNKYGIRLWVYETKRKEVGVVYVEVKGGHFQEFYDKKSTFIYYIIQGRGTFFLNGKSITVKANRY